MNFLRTEDVDRQARKLIEGFLSYEEKPIMNRTVHQLLWGYEDRLLQLVKTVLPKVVESDIISVYNASVIQFLILSRGFSVTTKKRYQKRKETFLLFAND